MPRHFSASGNVPVSLGEPRSVLSSSCSLVLRKEADQPEEGALPRCRSISCPGVTTASPAFQKGEQGVQPWLRYPAVWLAGLTAVTRLLGSGEGAMATGDTSAKVNKYFDMTQ